MPRPRIVKETKRTIEEKEPPHSLLTKPHDWLKPDSLEEYEKIKSSGRCFDAYLSYSAEAKIRKHASKHAQDRLEVMGFLLGEVKKWKGKIYAVVRAIGTTDLQSSSSKVRFDPKAFPRLFMDLDNSGFDYVLVGWYHSHPGHTCFLSRTDLKTQREMFSQPYHIALVIDPINREIRAFRLADDSYEEAVFALFDEAPAANSPTKKARTRKLKMNPVTTS